VWTPHNLPSTFSSAWVAAVASRNSTKTFLKSQRKPK
jgi:hypothetical protein